MAPEEVDRIREIDLSESGEVVYKWVNGRVEATPEKWTRPGTYGDGWWRRAEKIRARLAGPAPTEAFGPAGPGGAVGGRGEEGGAAWGAFDGGRLVGFLALQYRLAEDVALLAALWVSREHRRQGIAAALTGEACRLAKESGARAMYVSATPSESAQGFYRSQGFRPTQFVHVELYRAEPEDIHMVKEL